MIKEEESKAGRNALYLTLYNKLVYELEKNPKYSLGDCLEASVLLLVNTVKIVERNHPHTKIRVLDHLLQLFDDEAITLKDDEKKPH